VVAQEKRQMSFKPVIPFREVENVKWGGLYTESDPAALPMGASPQCYDIDFFIAGMGTRPGLSNPITSYSPTLPSGCLIEWLKSMRQLLGPKNQTLMQESSGGLWVEDLTNQGVFNRIYNGVLSGARAISETIGAREYICLSDLTQGLDEPRQWDGTNLDRISQVGPGVGPSVPSVSSPLFPIQSITEIYTPVNLNSISWGSAINLYTAQQPSQMLVFLSAVGSTTFTKGLNVGDIVYVSGSVPLNGFDQNGTYTVEFIGLYTDADGTRQYFQVTANQVNNDFARNTAVGQFQKTQALVQLTNPLPQQDVVVGNKVSIAGASVAQWDGTWSIVATPTEGQLQITSTELAGNVATYDYNVISGTAPGWQADTFYAQSSQIVDPAGSVWQITTPGISGATIPPFVGPTQNDGSAVWTLQPTATMSVTVFNTSNGNGIFNVQNAFITSANQTSFRIALTSPNIVAAAETGLAVSGTGSALIIDPGTKSLGSGNPGSNPIYGNSTGGNILVVDPNVAPGLRYAVVLYETRNGYITAQSPPVAFYTTGASTKLTFNNIPIGPPDVTRRIVAITLANAGIGGPYFYIPKDVLLPGSAASLGQTVTVNKTVIDDNTSTSLGPIDIRDDVLANSVNVTVPGNNLQQQREIGPCVKVVQFMGRAFYLGERVKVDQFVNATFDGGSVNGLPTGWTIASSISPLVGLQPSPSSGQSLYIRNILGVTFNPLGSLNSYATLSQTAHETYLNTEIIQESTPYSVRIKASIPSGNTSGSLVVELYSPSLNQNWPAVIPFSALSTTLTELTFSFGNPPWTPVPSDLQLRVYPRSLAPTADVLIDRLEVFPTQQPVYTTQIAASYIENYESVDAVTGKLDTSANTSEPLTDHYRFLDRYFVTTDNRTFSPIQTLDEPSGWEIREVSNAAGSLGPLASDVGPEYVVSASHDGVYIFDGGSHQKIFREIQQIWDLIYEPARRSIWIKNDIKSQRILIGLPLPTPNKFLPNAAENLAPFTPNVILMCSYLGLPTGRDIAAADPVTVSMFTGSLLFHDKRRKWTIWQIPPAIGNIIDRADGSREVWFGQTAKISKLDPNAITDNGAAIASSYTTFSHQDPVTMEKFRLPAGQKLYGYFYARIEGAGSWTLTSIPEDLATPYADTQPPFLLVEPALDDTQAPLNEVGNRMYIRIASDGLPGTNWTLTRTVLGLSECSKFVVTGR